MYAACCRPARGTVYAGWRLVGIAMMMAIWWVTAAIDIAAALVPGCFSAYEYLFRRAAATPFGRCFLLLGGFLIACTLQLGIFTNTSH